MKLWVLVCRPYRGGKQEYLFPDISMIPSIGYNLGITADELFNINLEERRKEFQRILDLDDFDFLGETEEFKKLTGEELC